MREKRQKMDYTLAALKLMCAQLKQAKQTPSQSSFTFGGILFQRAWVQGLLVSVPDPDDNNDDDDDDNRSRFLLDDGTSVIELFLSESYLKQNKWVTGMYVMVVGSYHVPAGKHPLIKVHKIVDLSANPNRLKPTDCSTNLLWKIECRIYKRQISAKRVGCFCNFPG